MDTLNAQLLNDAYGSVIMPDARCSVPFGWFSAVDTMMKALHDLPTDVRAYLMVTGIYRRADGLLGVDTMMLEDYMPVGGRQFVEDIVQRAVTLTTWTCVKDGRPGWWSSVPGKGASIRCACCQGLEEGARPHVA
jgi:hypothetical protein